LAAELLVTLDTDGDAAGIQGTGEQTGLKKMDLALCALFFLPKDTHLLEDPNGRDG
jgi:hypothetical protein